jgi:hypothetical protein
MVDVPSLERYENRPGTRHVVLNNVGAFGLNEKRQGGRYPIVKNADQQILTVILAEVLYCPSDAIERVAESIAGQVFDFVRSRTLPALRPECSISGLSVQRQIVVSLKSIRGA